MNENLAWAAGILEGEGCFSMHKRSNRPNTFCYAIHCEMSDEDVVRKLLATFGIGTVVVRLNISGRRDTRQRKQTWIWSVQNKAGIVEVLKTIRPYMGLRRGTKIDIMLGSLREDC